MMFKNARSLVGLLAGLSILLAACRPTPSDVATETADPNAVFTAAAATANFRMTEIAASTPSLPPATATQPQPSPTAATSTVAAITATTPVTTTAAGPSTGAQGSDRAQWVADVTIPDGTNFAPNESFTKTWRLQNIGTSTWSSTYSLVFVSGAPMTTSTTVPLNQEVAPGGTVDVSVNMAAPSDPGNYKGFWQVANDQGTAFEVAFWVDINVGGTAGAATSTPGGATSTPGASAATAGPTGSASNTVANVTSSVNTSTYEGSCPYTFMFPAQFTLGSATTVTYKFEAGSDSQGFQITLPDPTTVSLQAGTHDVTYQLEFSQAVSGWARLHVTAPNDVTSSQTTFSLTCQ